MLTRYVPLTEHWGPGPHAHTGTPQVVHAGGRAGRRARAWASMAKKRPGGPAGAYQKGTTEAAIGKRRQWGAGKAPEFKGIDSRDLVSELASYTVGGNRPSAAQQVSAGRLTRELAARGYHGGGMQKRGAGYNSLPPLKGGSKADRGIASGIRRRRLAEIDLDLRARDSQHMNGLDKPTLKGVRDMISKDRRTTWWIKNGNMSGEDLVDMVYRRESLGFKREAGNLAYFTTGKGKPR